MGTHSSTLAWRIPWTEEPGGLRSTESQKELDMTEWLNDKTGKKKGDRLLRGNKETSTDVLKTPKNIEMKKKKRN